MAKQFTITVYADPLNMFAKVKRQVINDLGIASHISSSSHQRDDYVFLSDEGDDIDILCQRINEHGTAIKFVEKYTDKPSRIRSYERYQPTA